MTDYEKRFLPVERWVSWGAFLILLITYWLTVAPTVSFWDCPEYVSAAYLLEVGHPPGNPVWMLVERVITMLAPTPRHAAIAVNLSSGLFTALAAFFLAKTIFRVALWVLLRLPRRRIPAPLAAAGGALTGALAFGWCDSAWYSAVEAEVYAMSIFMTARCVWLMTKWAGTRNRQESWRLLILIAYLFGLSIGIHQLNLLCIPALAMVWAVRRGIRSTGRLALILLLSLVAVACVLMGMMPSTIALAAQAELMAVNSLGLPALSGVAAYVALTAAALLLAISATRMVSRRGLVAAACWPAVFLSGIFIFSEHFLAGALISAAAAFLLVCGPNFKARRLCLAMWMLTMLMTGYSSYALIPIRGAIPSPANAAMPGEPFSFAAYQSREQYGAKPLLYGPTPYSRPMLREDYDSAGFPFYRFYDIKYDRPVHVRLEPGARLRGRIAGLSETDSTLNARMIARGGDAYVVKGMHSRTVRTPELNMWFPRITSSDPSDLKSYAEWIGMQRENMTEVRISEAFDSIGNAVPRADAAGQRIKPLSHRPTYLQNAAWFATYQTGYMYWRYLLWNFSGRQNDRSSQGEVQHGNFITGFPAIDNAMLGAEQYLPPVAGNDNKGRNRYFMLPLLIGIIGICWLLKSRRRGMEVCAVTAVLFVMTGLAITVYLNQDPGEPRERDYSFLGSYWAFCVWIGFGAIMIARRFRSVWGFLLPLAVTGWMCAENYDDHDRSGRYAARSFAVSILEAAEPDAVIFVNGDNYTFPLWYAQEVEEIRRDVRVVNLAYLTSPVYAANLMKDWRGSRALETVLQREDVIWDAFRSASIATGATDTIAATAALDSLRRSTDSRFPVRYVTLDVSPDSTAVYDLTLLKGGSQSVDFGRLMMFDIIASNSISPRPRPIYWIRPLSAERRIGLTAWTSPWLFGYRFGLRPDSVTDWRLYEETRKVLAPNAPGREVYMDRAPAMQTAAIRGALTVAALRFLQAGDIDRAVETARRADTGMGGDPGTFIPVSVADTVFNTRLELGRLLTACADSLEQRDGKKNAKSDAAVLELRARGQYHIRQHAAARAAWREYRRNLPPRLRDKMSPVY